MTGSELMLDTSIVIDLFKKVDQVVSVVARSETIVISVTVLGELYLGAYRSVDPETKVKEIQAFLTTCKLLEIQQSTAETYAKAKTALLRKGKPIPDNDIWIAALALQYNLELYTTDAHFREVDGLRHFNPLSPA